MRTIEQALVTQQDIYAQSQGLIAQGLVQVYRAMGGRLGDSLPGPAAGAAESYVARQQLPMPLPTLPTRAPETVPTPPNVPQVLPAQP